MAKRLVFLVHGMGDHRPGWSALVTQRFADIARGYPTLADGSLLDDVDFVEVTYDDVFASQVRQIAGDAAELEKFARQALPAGTVKATLGKVLTWLRQDARPGESAFFWTHVVDVLLYRYFRLVRDPVRLTVMKQFAEALADAETGGEIADAFVVAHTLGTAVAADALALLGTTPFDGSEAFLAGREKFKHVFTLANVSRLLEDDIDPYTSVLRPDSATLDPAPANPPPPAYCSRFTTFRHVLDPFCWLLPFEPPSWGSDFTNVNDLTHLRAINVHGFEHYLDNPRVHIPILNGIFERPVISAAAREQAIARYPPIAGPCADELRALGQALQELPMPTDLQNVLICVTKGLALGRAAQERCAGLASALHV
jgi:hypothetical protein